jgi:HAD superfamily hydrolase (TIGR01484 family)
MRYSLIATDGDGTILIDGKLPASTRRALERAREANVLVVLVTGETSAELVEFPALDLFHLAVAENGAVLMNPLTWAEVVLGRRPPARLISELRESGINDLKVGRSIVSSKMENAERMRDVVERLSLDWHVVPNRHDVMILPRGIDKASGVAVALNELNVPAKKAIAIGDAENDTAMLKYCGLGVAVSDAVPYLKEHSDLVTQRGAGYGFAEIVDRVLNDDLPVPSTRNYNANV